MSENAFLKRLREQGNLIIAEGYLFEFERRGYLKAGAYVPEVVLEHPDLVRSLTQEFVHAGSEISLAFTYYAHRKKLSLIGREDDLETINKRALQIAKDVAKETGTLFAGNVCNTTHWLRNKPETHREAELMFKEQIEWAVEAGVDVIIGETFAAFGEAMLALKSIQKYGKGVPAVICLVPSAQDTTFDGVPLPDACRQLEEAGAAVVGLNCGRGPATMLPLVRQVRAVCKGPIACLPVPYRTSEEHKTMQSLIDPFTGERAFPVDLPSQLCGRSEIEHFARSCKEMGVDLVGLCCGNSSHCTRVVATAYGRQPPACRYTPDMSQHYIWGDKSKFKTEHTEELVLHKI